MEFIWPGPAPRSGQFFLIKPRRTGVFLSRPISVAGWKPRNNIASGETNTHSADKNSSRRVKIERRKNPKGRIEIDRRLDIDRRFSSGGILRFLVLRQGQGSRELVDLRPGEEAEITGPLGNSWKDASALVNFSEGTHDKAKSSIALVGGGVGIAPLIAYALESGNKSYDFYAGFRTGSFGLEKISPKFLIIATEDGSHGLKGKILDFFAPTGYNMVFACGPEPMLKIIADSCIASDVPCFISLERHMACGVGACMGCTVKTIHGNKRCCSEGPIFNGEEVVFES